jgi:hypothetical protein
LVERGTQRVLKSIAEGQKQSYFQVGVEERCDVKKKLNVYHLSQAGQGTRRETKVELTEKRRREFR